MSKDKVQVAAQIYPVNGVINVDYRYGPYESIAEAVEFLGPDNLDCIKAGLKFGIKETDGTVTDYVFLEDNGGADKVRKVLHIDEATTENAGLMSAQDKAALSAVQAKAQENADDIDALEQDMAEANTGIQQNASAIQTNASDIASANTTISQILAANAELRTTVNGLVGISNDNFMGIFQTANDLPTMTAPGWALVGTSLSSLLLYTYTDVNGVWTKYSDDTYDFTDYSGLVTQVAQIGSKIGDLESEVAFIGDEEGSGDPADFTPSSDTVWNKPQTLSSAQKATARANIGAVSNEEMAQQISVVNSKVDSIKPINLTNNGTITNLADEEDITSENNLLKLKDRYNYVILRSNKTFASQVTKANTIYEIRYDFTLDSDFTMPANCVLKFEGGSIISTSANEPVLNLNSAIIKSDIKQIFSNVVVTNIGNEVFHVKWYLTDGETITASKIKNVTNKTIDFDGLTITLSDNVAVFEEGVEWINGIIYAKLINFGEFNSLKEGYISKSSEEITCSEDLSSYIGKICVVKIGEHVPMDYREVDNIPTLYRGITSVISDADNDSFKIIDTIENFDATYSYTSQSEVETTIESKVQVFNPINVTLKNCTFKALEQNQRAFVFVFCCKDIVIEDCTFIGHPSGMGGVLGLNYCVGGFVKNTQVRDSYYTGTTTSYGIQCYSSTRVLIDSCTLENHRRAVDMSGSLCESRYNIVQNCSVVGAAPVDGSCIGGHATSYGNIFRNNILNGGSSLIAIQLRGQNEIVEGNIIAVPSLRYVITCVINTVIRNNVVQAGTTAGNFVAIEYEDTEVAGNTIGIYGNQVHGVCNNISLVKVEYLKQRLIILNNVFCLAAQPMFVPAISSTNGDKVIAYGNTFIDCGMTGKFSFSRKRISESSFTQNDEPITKDDRVEFTFDLLKHGCVYANNNVDDSLERLAPYQKFTKATLYVNNVHEPKLLLHFVVHFDSTNYANFLCFNFDTQNIIKLDDFVPSDGKLLRIRRQRIVRESDNTEVSDQRIIATCNNNTIYVSNLCNNAGRLEYGYIYDIECELTALDSDAITYSEKIINANHDRLPKGLQTYKGMPIYWGGGRWNNSDGVGVQNVTSVIGSTDVRTAMSLNTANEGLRYYDTTLKKYVLWNGTAWVNIDGSALS